MKKIFLLTCLTILTASMLFAGNANAAAKKKAKKADNSCVKECNAKEHVCLNTTEDNKGKEKACRMDGDKCRKACKKKK